MASIPNDENKILDLKNADYSGIVARIHQIDAADYTIVMATGCVDEIRTAITEANATTPEAIADVLVKKLFTRFTLFQLQRKQKKGKPI